MSVPASSDLTFFIEDRGMFYRDDFPFERVWEQSGFNKYSYQYLYIAPVNIENLIYLDWWQSIPVEKRALMANELGLKMRASLKQAFYNRGTNFFTLVDQPSTGTLILEWALVDVAPNKVVMHALRGTLGFFNPLVGFCMSGITLLTNKTSLSFEARLRVIETNEVVATFTDRRYRKFSFINIKDFTWYGHLYEIIDDWSREFFDVINWGGDGIIQRTSNVEVLPW